MSGGNWSYPKTWLDLENLTTEDLNAEFQAVLDNADALGTGGSSDTVLDMQAQTSPGDVGSESLATSQDGENQRLRYQIAQITGNQYWYQPPAISLDAVASALGSQIATNRIVSGTSRSNGQPVYLIPAATGTNAVLDCSTPFVAVINNVEYTQTTNLTLSVSTAPSSNNGANANDATLSGQAYSKLYGEKSQFGAAQDITGGGALSYFNPRFLNINNVGSEISVLSGEFAAFKVNSEYFWGQLSDSADYIFPAFRGYFFNSSSAPIQRGTISNGDTITLMRTAYIFFKGGTTNSIFATYNPPSVQSTAPLSPLPGDMWFDTTVSSWKIYDGSSFTVNNSIWIGLIISDATGVIGGRSFDFLNSFSSTNSMYVSSSSSGSSVVSGGKCSVYSKLVDLQGVSRTILKTSVDPDSGALSGTEAVYLYVDQNTNFYYSDIAPYNRFDDLLGCYHPYAPWRCITSFSQGSTGSALNYFFNYYDKQRPTNYFVSSSASISQLANTAGGAVVYSPFFSFSTVLEPGKSTFFALESDRHLIPFFVAGASGYFGRYSVVNAAATSVTYGRAYFPLPSTNIGREPIGSANMSLSEFNLNNRSYLDVTITLDFGSSNSNQNGLQITSSPDSGSNVNGVWVKVWQE